MSINAACISVVTEGSYKFSSENCCGGSNDCILYMPTYDDRFVSIRAKLLDQSNLELALQDNVSWAPIRLKDEYLHINISDVAKKLYTTLEKVREMCVKGHFENLCKGKSIAFEESVREVKGYSLKEAEIRQISEYISCNREQLQQEADRLPHKYLYIRASDELPRSLEVHPDRVCIHFNKIRKKKDRYLGSGASRKYRTACDFKTGNFFAVGVRRLLDPDTEYPQHRAQVLHSMKEVAILESLYGCEGVIGVLGSILVRGKNNAAKFFIKQPICEKGALVDNLVGLSNKNKLEITIHLIIALKNIHKGNWVHRDIKPDNTLLEGGNKVLIADWEFACHIRSPELGYRRGTLAYSSPEYAKDLLKNEIKSMIRIFKNSIESQFNLFRSFLDIILNQISI